MDKGRDGQVDGRIDIESGWNDGRMSRVWMCGLDGWRNG